MEFVQPIRDKKQIDEMTKVLRKQSGLLRIALASILVALPTGLAGAKKFPQRHFKPNNNWQELFLSWLTR